MNDTLSNKIKDNFSAMVIYKNPGKNNSLFTGRNLPSFVKDFLLKRFIDSDGNVNTAGLTSFLDIVIPKDPSMVKDALKSGKDLTLLCRFIINIDLVKNIKRFSIPDMGIKLSEGQIPDYVCANHGSDLSDGEKWGIIKICLLPNDDGKKYHVEMIDYKPFKPYTSVDVNYLVDARKNFNTAEWIDLLISAMEYDPEGFDGLTQKMEFLTRLLIFIEPRLNTIELAPKGTGKSYVFGNLSKYGWLVSGGKVTRAKLFWDKQKQQNGIMKSHDFVAFDEIQTIEFQEPSEIQAALKSYLESGKTTIDNQEFSSECGLMLMGNIPLSRDRQPLSHMYFDNLPKEFKESALLDRFHCFIEGWKLPRINTSMILEGWTLNVEYFSEIIHELRTQSIYGQLYDQLVSIAPNTDMRDAKAVQRIATAYMKLLFPHWRTLADVDINEFKIYCLNPALYRRGIIKEQCHNIDPEFKKTLTGIEIKNL